MGFGDPAPAALIRVDPDGAATVAAGRLDEAEHLAAHVLDAEPLREAAWRLRMRLADALGAGDSVLRVYQACERALAQIGTTPSRTTRELLERLRR